METLKCKICGEEFTYKKLSTCKARMTVHLREKHNISVEDYLVEYELNGKHPKCLCGCGNNVTLDRSWKWHKYYKDSHVGKAFTEAAERVKKEMVEARKVYFDSKEYYKNKYDMSVARNSASDFLSKNYTLSDLAEKYKLDKRTLKKMWIELDLVSGEQYAKITSLLKYTISKQKRFENGLASDNCYTYVYNLIKNNPQKYNIISAIREYNKNDDYKISINPFVFYNQLKKLYGDEIDLYISKGYHSKEEYSFLCVLQHFFGIKNVKLGEKISKERYGFIYDFCIKDKLLIEYDSKGTYHKDEKQNERDKKKEEEAIKNGYAFLRITYEESKDINILKKIMECLNL